MHSHGANARAITFTVFPHEVEPQGERTTDTWESLAANFREDHDARKVYALTPKGDKPKATMPGWSPAAYKGNKRALANVEHVTLIVIDIDAGATLESLRAALSGYRAIVHSSMRHTPETPKFRAIIDVSRDMTPEEFVAVRRHVSGILVRVDDAATKDASRFFYAPAYTEATAPHAVFETFEGEPLDVDAIVADAPVVAPRPSASTTPRQGVSSPDLVRRAASHLTRKGPALQGQRNEAGHTGGTWTKILAADLLASGLDVDGVTAAMSGEWNDRCVPPWDPDELREAVGRAREFTGSNPFFLENLIEKWSPGNGWTGGVAVGANAQVPANDAMGKAPKDSRALKVQWGGWDEEPEPVEYLVHGLLPAGAVAMFYGHADSCKTWLLFDLAVAVAKGAPWMGHATRKGRVLIIDEETGTKALRRRLFKLGAGDTNGLGAASFSALKAASREFWIELMKEEPDLVIIDSLRKSNPGSNENDSAESIEPLIHAAEFAEATGCAVVFIHHAKKAGDGWPEHRGSAAIKDQVDCSFAVRKNDVTELEKRIDVRCDKPGDMPSPAPFAVGITFDDVRHRVDVRAIDATARGDSAQGSLADQILALCNPYAAIRSKSDLAKIVGGRKATAMAEIKRLEDRGDIATVDGIIVRDSEAARMTRIREAVTERNGMLNMADLTGLASVRKEDVQTAIRRNVVDKPNGKFVPGTDRAA